MNSRSGIGDRRARSKGEEERQQGLDFGKSSEGGAEIDEERGGPTAVEGMETQVDCALPSEQGRSASGLGAAGIMSYPGEAESGRGTVEGMSLG